VPNMKELVDKIISERPFVKILAEPRYQVYEIVPGLSVARWEALAQVNESLAIIELSVKE
jgi:hypothetical protein